ncbi:MAG: LD-carboxypeptidase [Lachnospiraceae bacterium]|nr:LD-carboxypeptidase [Lachnospiraceae bacterium]
MRYPNALPNQGKIGFVAPSFGCAIEPYRTAFDHALTQFHQQGYGTVLGPNTYADCGIGISNTPQLCAKELMEAYQSKESDVLISCGGGELMCEVVPYLDFQAIRDAAPKWYMGYSDNTNFTFLSATLADTAAIYGPCAASFGMEPWHESLQDAMDVLCGRSNHVGGYPLWEIESKKDETHPLAPYHLTEQTHYVYAGEQREAHMSGRLIGGCMDCLVTLLGTSFDGVKDFADRYAQDGILWFLEACDLNVMGIRRSIWQMKHAGWFRHVKGFLIGRPMHYGEDLMGLTQYEAVTELLREYDVPIVMDLCIGHLPPMMPLVTGAMANVDAVGDEIHIQYEFR